MIESIVLVIYSNRKYKDKNGTEHTVKIYYLQLANHSRIAIQPSFTEDYDKLNLLAKVEYNDSLPKQKNDKKD